MEFFTPSRFISILNRKKSDPGEFNFTGNLKVDEPDIQLFKYSKDECDEIKTCYLKTSARLKKMEAITG
jgi:hypothetical protein